MVRLQEILQASQSLLVLMALSWLLDLLTTVEMVITLATFVFTGGIKATGSRSGTILTEKMLEIEADIQCL